MFYWKRKAESDSCSQAEMFWIRKRQALYHGRKTSFTTLRTPSLEKFRLSARTRGELMRYNLTASAPNQLHTSIGSGQFLSLFDIFLPSSVSTNPLTIRFLYGLLFLTAVAITFRVQNHPLVWSIPSPIKSAGKILLNCYSLVVKGQCTCAKGIDPLSNQQSKTYYILRSLPLPLRLSIVSLSMFYLCRSVILAPVSSSSYLIEPTHIISQPSSETQRGIGLPQNLLLEKHQSLASLSQLSNFFSWIDFGTQYAL